MMGLSSVLATTLLALRLFSQDVLAAPAPAPAPVPQATTAAAAAGGFWVASIERRGTSAFGDANYKIYRNVKDYGAKGDGSTDDTVAIQAAMDDGNRCGFGCDSQTTTPALVYFPTGTYVVSKPIVMKYYTHMVGDATALPTIKAAASFAGMAVIDADPYDNQGNNAHTNQNNFWKLVRNFNIDLTGMPFTSGAGIHWQVAQATSLQNIVFNMRTDGGDANVQQGIFIDNGSGGFMTDLTFNGGKYGAFMGSQQFTSRNMTFNNCKTAIYMNWNWLWTFQDLKINNCGVGIDMSNGGATAQTVGSVLLLDSVISNTPVGVLTAYSPSETVTNGTLILDNVDMSTNVPAAVQIVDTKANVLAGNQKIASFIQGKTYTGTAGNGKAVQGAQDALVKPAGLLASDGKVVTRSKPQYENVAASSFLSAKANGCKGDGKTDDTAAIQALVNKAGPNDIVYFDHGAYIISDTIEVPKDIKITGEVWPLLMANGAAFKDQANPKVMFRVGKAGDVGTFEMSDVILQTQGPQPGAILMEYNIAGSTPGAAGLWDVHFRIGGSAGTQLQSDKCAKNPNVTTTANPECMGAYMLTHMTAESSGYFENTWWWVADHELDLADRKVQLNIYNGRGVLCEATKGTWFWGTASEHSVLYNYQFNNASNVFMGHVQTETAYFQGNPDARTPFTVNNAILDPNFETSCAGQGDKCARTWGIRAIDSKDIIVYGAGLYSFFNNYDQVCVGENNCQDHMVSLENSDVKFFGLSTKASVNMVTVNGKGAALDTDNRNNFCATVALFQAPL
ncbi:glucan 1,3-beta-glucosidase [Colletotrichum spaethianum]|uniref:Glucan 1,3-beta-glucosidase n=1 Tax=Colletotrichum spaethianum TaxID=700344 RepID=A0AA37P8G7_9PEZI|nr:glucan 1,3-beta-glucosidase [Colletotrichum spaethianum]GKT47587.1 glucan 1,3-beta-glucosidase [Colletotrichum spaethianum]